MPYIDKLKMIKKDKGLTNTEIADLSNIPAATITRVFNGQTPNPTFETISRIAIAMGTSLDELIGLKQPDEPQLPSPIENTLNSYSELLKDKDDRIKELKDERDAIRKEKHWITMILIVLLVFVLGILTYGYFTR